MRLDIYFVLLEHYVGTSGVKITLLNNCEIVFIPRQVVEIQLLAGVQDEVHLRLLRGIKEDLRNARTRGCC